MTQRFGPAIPDALMCGICAMAEMDEVTGNLKKLEGRIVRELNEARAQQEVRFARMLVVIATVAIFLVISMGWYVDLDVDDDNSLANASGWDVFSAMVSFSSEGVFVFGGYYSWVVVLAALAGGAAAPRLTRRWICVTLSTLLTLLALGHLVIAAQVEEDFDGQQLAGGWAAIAVMLFAATVWGHLYRQLREHSPV